MAAGIIALGFSPPLARADNRWKIDDDGGITWIVQPGAGHQDNIEMDGRKVALIATYGVDDTGKLTLSRQLVFPMLRSIPNNTRAHLALVFGDDDTPRIFINRAAPRNEAVVAFHQKGIMRIDETFGKAKDITLTRALFPSTDKPLVLETFTFANHSDKPITVELEQVEKMVRTLAERGVYGAYVASSHVLDAGEKTVAPGGSVTLAVAFAARKVSEPELTIDVAAEERARRERVDSLLGKLQLETPDRVLNTAFAFAKIRTAESIYETKSGLMHGPGGGTYYAAIWANDQAEYANPFFAYLGDPTATESAINAYRLFAKYMNSEYKPIPSSIISEGADTWHGAGDRGDMAMIAYGASRFALAYGKPQTAEELWPLIEWCLEYLRRKTNDAGVIASDSDELENRFPSGKANLCTSALCYDALNSAVMLGQQLGKPQAQVTQYAQRAKELRTAIERYFGANLEGFDTYRYYDGNTVLRAWICIPLTVGIMDRADGTIAALFSPRLWTPDGLATQAGDRTFWDRSTLYALRGVFAAGATQKALDYLVYYSNRRLLGEHVPYPVEAYPEGNQRHLAAESALYCRIYTEGLFGLRPTGFKTFTLTPRLPEAWPAMKLSGLDAFGTQFDVKVARSGDQLEVQIVRAGRPVQTHRIAPGATVTVELAE